jgi:bifunctional DNase/RNase
MSLLGRRDEVQEAAGADVEVRIRGLMMDQSTHTPIVVLNDLAGEVMLPIWVGLFEASAIAMEIEKATTPRPMTHDLLRDVIHGLDAKVKRVVVGSLEENTFHASIWMEQQGAPVVIDARPSDAIALALRADCPIFVSHALLERARNSSTRDTQTADLKRWFDNLNDEDMGRYKM